MRETILNIARELLTRPTAPFREHAIRDYIRRFAARRGFRVAEDDMGNLLVTYGGKHRNPVLAFAAHMDHPGFIVERDSRRGTATARFYGGIEREYFAGTGVRAFTPGGEVAGRVLSTRFSARKEFLRARIEVDGKVRKGDPAMWDVPPFRERNGRIYSRACDDLIGCTAILACLDRLWRRQEKKKVMGVFTVAEEAGFHGAAYLCARGRVPKSVCIVSVETSRELPAARMGDGVVIRVGDRGSIFTPQVTAFAVRAARLAAAGDRTFKYQRKLMDGGTCEATIYQMFGHTQGAVCIPLRNYHNRDFHRKKVRAEYVSIDDLENMVKLFLAMVNRVERLPEFLKPRPPKFRQERGDMGERFVWTKRRY